MRVRPLAYCCVVLLVAGCADNSTNPPPLDFGPGQEGSVPDDLAGADLTGVDGIVTGDGGPDTQPPTIMLMTPMAGNIVGGVITVSATITDDQGVDDKTVTAVFTGNLMYQVALANTGNNLYQAKFDMGQLGTGFVYPSMSIRADDKAGNHAELAVELVLDNVPPTITMDSPAVFASKAVTMGNNTTIECSQPFRPLGDESTRDGQTVKQIVTLRGRIADSGNSGPGQQIFLFAGTDPNSAKVSIIPPANGPLVVDSNGDGICDELNPHLIPTTGPITSSDQSIELELVPLQKGGLPNFFPSAMAPPAGCQTIGDPGVMAAPGPLCPNLVGATTITYVLMNGLDPVPQVFSIPPVVSNTFQCEGLQFDSKNRIGPGKACAAVQASDLAGNRSVSAPLHFCIDNGAGSCTGYTFAATDCTGKLDSMGNVIAGSTCTARTFPASNEVVPIQQ
jgi:hypothetical protein